jgi:hypothetical protein
MFIPHMDSCSEGLIGHKKNDNMLPPTCNVVLDKAEENCRQAKLYSELHFKLSNRR